MASRRAFFASAGTFALAAPAYPDLGPIFATRRRHRQVFGIRRVADGAGFHQMTNSLDAYEFARREGPYSLHAIAVLYGPSVALALDDETWTRHRVARVLELLGDPVARAAQRPGNPFLSAGSADGERPAARDASLDALLRRGAGVLVCDNALTDFALSIATLLDARHATPDSVRADLHAGLVRGTTLVPAGVAALNDAQEARYTYVAV